jgi:hypothetical protein
VAGVSLALAACGGGGGTERNASQTQAVTTASPTSSSDPLEGEWRAEFTCQQTVRAIERRLPATQVGSLKEFLGTWWQVEPKKNDPCHSATGLVAVMARFADGNLALCDAETGDCEVSATYELLDDHSISVNDEEGNLCTECPVTWKFEINGDELTFHVSPDLFVIGTWEAAPWIRAS